MSDSDINDRFNKRFWDNLKRFDIPILGEDVSLGQWAPAASGLAELLKTIKLGQELPLLDKVLKQVGPGPLSTLSKATLALMVGLFVGSLLEASAHELLQELAESLNRQLPDGGNDDPHRWTQARRLMGAYTVRYSSINEKEKLVGSACCVISESSSRSFQNTQLLLAADTNIQAQASYRMESRWSDKTLSKMIGRGKCSKQGSVRLGISTHAGNYNLSMTDYFGVPCMLKGYINGKYNTSMNGFVKELRGVASVQGRALPTRGMVLAGTENAFIGGGEAKVAWSFIVS